MNYFFEKYCLEWNSKWWLVGFYGISTLVGYLILNPQLCIYIKNIQHYSFVCTQLNGPKYCYVSLTIQLDISH